MDAVNMADKTKVGYFSILTKLSMIMNTQVGSSSKDWKQRTEEPKLQLKFQINVAVNQYELKLN